MNVLGFLSFSSFFFFHLDKFYYIEIKKIPKRKNRKRTKKYHLKNLKHKTTTNPNVNGEKILANI